MKKFETPKSDWIIVKIPKKTDKIGSLKVVNAETDRIDVATIVAIGTGAYHNGTFVDTAKYLQISVGDKVIIDNMQPRVPLGDDYWAMKPGEFIVAPPTETDED